MNLSRTLVALLGSAIFAFAQEGTPLDNATAPAPEGVALAETAPAAPAQDSVATEAAAKTDSSAAEVATPAETDLAKNMGAPDTTDALRETGEEASTISVFVKRPEEIQALQNDLVNLKNLAGEANPAIDSLLAKASRIAEMNSRCASISLTDVLDTNCSHFYEVDLPAFENEFMELTGEVRLGSMRMASTLEERSQQLLSCSDALTSIVVPRDQLLKLKGNIYLEPINLEGDFDAEYRYTLSLDPTRMQQQERLANLWLSKCGDIVLRQTGEEFAPMFVAALKFKNDSLKKAGSNVKLLLNKDNLSVRVNMRRAISGAYYLNGEKLFSKELPAAGEKTHLRFDVKNKKALLEMGEDGVLENFKGRLVFKDLKKQDMAGRWMWDENKSTDEALDEADNMTAEDSLVYEQVLTAAAEADSIQQDSNQVKASAAAADAVANAEPKGGIRWVPVAISGAVAIGGGVMAAVFNSKAKSEKEDFEKELDKEDNSKYKKHKDNADSYQTMRAVGIGLSIVGAVGLGLSFIF